jgi:hypothetical protein
MLSTIGRSEDTRGKHGGGKTDRKSSLPVEKLNMRQPRQE